MATLGTWKQGDTFVVDHQIRHPADGPNLVGQPVDLTTASTVHVAGYRLNDLVATIDTQAVVLDAEEGQVRFTVSPSDSAVPAMQRVEFVVTWADGQQTTWPRAASGRQYETLEIAPDVAAVNSPQMTTAPDIGGSVQQGAIYVGDGETATLTENGIVVFASATANLVVAPGVTIFSVAPNPVAAAWAVGNVPTIGQAGATIDPTVFSTMEAATGDPIVVALYEPTMTYYSAAGGASSGALEVGHGDTLPVNGAVFQLFEVESSTLPAVVPDGLYRWDDQSNNWVQV